MTNYFKYNGKQIEVDKDTILCGIVNVTPDSFSDGGKWFGKEEAVKRGLELVEQGAGMLDIGGESTRPGSTYVDIQEEIDRIVPVIKELKSKVDVPISVDTWKSEVAKAAIEAGADIINDITGLLGDPKMAEVVGSSDAGLIIMFNPVKARPNHPSSTIFPKFGENPFTEEELKSFEDMEIIELMKKYFNKSLERCETWGINRDRIFLDPGIGFGLTKKENLTLINNVDILHEKGYYTFVGVSRKRFIVNILEEGGFDTNLENEEANINRDLGSAFLTSIATMKGANVLRVHVIPEHKMARDIARAVRFSENSEDINFEAYKR